MDAYFEHLVPIKKDGKTIALFLLIWVFWILLTVAALFLLLPNLPFILLISGVGLYGSVMLTKKLYGEYEYIFTNGEIDIDVIIGKSERKRIMTFNCADIERVERYNPKNPLSNREKFERVGVYCNKDDTDAFTLVLKNKTCITMDIPKKMQQEMIGFMDKLLAREAFK